MKKKILFILALAAVLLSACKMKLSENTGTVIIDFGSNERAVDTNGLPFIKDAEMSLEIISSNGSEKKEFAAGQEKTWSGSFPVGERIGIKVTISTASAEWKGSTGHTVKEGANKVEIKLKKSVAALKGLLFGIYKQLDPSGAAGYDTLTLKIGSKEITKTNVVSHSFCRDNKGRTYLAYNTGNAWNIERYTSEGDKESKTFNLPERCYELILASDHATGAVYLAAGIRGGAKVYRIKEDGSFEEITLEGEGVAGIKIISTIAVYNDILIACIGSSELSSFKISGNKAEKLKDYALNDDTKIDLKNQGIPPLVYIKINDLYMTKDALYLLFSAFGNQSSGFYSLGGIVKYSYNPADGTISKIKRIGIEDSHTAQNGIYPTDESKFYGPVKVIGFDEQNLYIADDGIKFEFQKGKPRLTANKNRIAALKKEDDTLTFTDAPSGITWMSENPVWPGVNTKTIVWTKNSSNYGFDYYQLASAADTPEIGNSLAASESGDNYFTDVFCFDEAGNLYIAKYRNGGRKICRFELKDDGSYNMPPDIMDNAPQHPPVAIAVDISGSVKTADGNSANALYYSYDGSNQSNIERFTWGKNAAFSTAAADSSFGSSGVFKGPTDTFHPTQTTRFTALAADKNGFFVALKEEKEETGTSWYTVRVQKYTHDSAVGGAINVLGEVLNGSTWSRPGNLTALHIQEGILYGLTAVQYRYEYDNYNMYYKKDSISGKLIKIGSSTADFSGHAEILHTTELNNIHDPDADAKRKEGGKFAPYRFIAVKPKKLIIASDGFWGYITNLGDLNSDDVEQFHFIWDFSIKDDGSLEGTPQSTETDSAIEFSKTIARLSNSGYEWK